MKRILAISLIVLSTPSLAAPAAEQAMDNYQTCWSHVVSTLSINKPGRAKEHEARRLMKEADKVCGPQSDNAARLNSLQAVKETRQYMAIQFFNANFQMDVK